VRRRRTHLRWLQTFRLSKKKFLNRLQKKFKIKLDHAITGSQILKATAKSFQNCFWMNEAQTCKNQHQGMKLKIMQIRWLLNSAVKNPFSGTVQGGLNIIGCIQNLVR
jgi:hypothetical protein